jgi:Fur family ferric uptake transcriptional regulator
MDEKEMNAENLCKYDGKDGSASPSVEMIESLLGRFGVKKSRYKRALVKVLLQHHDHPDIQTVYDRLRLEYPKISVATVYRTIGVLEKSGLIVFRDLGDDKAHCELNLSQQPHYHFVDVDDQTITEFSDDKLTEQLATIARKKGYEIVSHKILLMVRKQS